MKMFLVIYAEASDETITAAFKKAGFKAYTKMHGATGEGPDSEPKLDTHCWPGRNNALFIAVQDDDIAGLCELVKRLKSDHPRAGLKAFTLPLEESI
ncbi:MAG: hypothetical protein CVU52_01775 [Deltaproteobacteria bacterium HGW-Deltaproteobacteria-10]|nr:MAG: hypothetical protein CVU52_01775 [Deltaproteobacteria bacterium HGW-Deltaproteobacteria-10]